MEPLWVGFWDRYVYGPGCSPGRSTTEVLINQPERHSSEAYLFTLSAPSLSHSSIAIDLDPAGKKGRTLRGEVEGDSLGLSDTRLELVHKRTVYTYETVIYLTLSCISDPSRVSRYDYILNPAERGARRLLSRMSGAPLPVPASRERPRRSR